MSAVGIDVGERSIKVAALEGTARKARVVRFAEVKIDEDRPSSQLDPLVVGSYILKALEKAKAPVDRVVTQVPAAQCLVRDLMVPFKRKDQIEKTLKFQAESAFHSLHLDRMLFDYHKTAEIGQKSKLIVCALPKEIMERRLEALGSIEVDPVAVDLDVGGLLCAYRGAYPQSHERAMIVDLGALSLKVIVIEDGRLTAIRSLRAKAAEVEVAAEGPSATKKKPRSLEELRKGLMEEEREDTFFADDEGRLPLVILDEESDLFDFDLESDEARQSLLEKLFFEIDRTLARALTAGPLDKILLTGGGAGAKGLEEAFASHFEVPTERLGLGAIGLAKLKGDEKEALERTGMCAVGLALKGLGLDPSGFDFRKEEFQFTGTLDRLKSGLACSLVLLFVLFFLIAYRFQIVESERLYRKQMRIASYQARIYKLVFNEEPEGNVLTAFRTKQKEVEEKTGSATPDVMSMLDVLRDLARATEEIGKPVTLKTVSFQQKNMLVELELDSSTFVYDLKKKLDEDAFLMRVASETVNQDAKTQRFRASIKLEAKEKPDDKRPASAKG